MICSASDRRQAYLRASVKRKKKHIESWVAVDVMFYFFLRQASNLMQAHAAGLAVCDPHDTAQTLHWMETRLF